MHQDFLLMRWTTNHTFNECTSHFLFVINCYCLDIQQNSATLCSVCDLCIYGSLVNKSVFFFWSSVNQDSWINHWSTKSLNSVPPICNEHNPFPRSRVARFAHAYCRYSTYLFVCICSRIHNFCSISLATTVRHRGLLLHNVNKLNTLHGLWQKPEL